MSWWQDSFFELSNDDIPFIKHELNLNECKRNIRKKNNEKRKRNMHEYYNVNQFYKDITKETFIPH